MFKIPRPLRSRQIYFYPVKENKLIELALPAIEDLPYACFQHYELLLRHLPVEDIVTVFTHMLFEQKTLLICPDYHMLLPISMALH